MKALCQVCDEYVECPGHDCAGPKRRSGKLVPLLDLLDDIHKNAFMIMSQAVPGDNADRRGRLIMQLASRAKRSI